MKKFLKVVLVLTLIAAGISLVLGLLSFFKADMVNNLWVDFYEEFTGEIGSPVEGLPKKIFIAFGIEVVFSIMIAVIIKKKYSEGSETMTKEEKQALKEAKRAARKAKIKEAMTKENIEEKSELVDTVVNAANRNAKTIDSFIESLKQRH